MTETQNVFIYCPGRHNLGPGRQFQHINLTDAIGQSVSDELDCKLGREKFINLVDIYYLNIYIYIYIYIYTRYLDIWK